jgi:hypothetical protein
MDRRAGYVVVSSVATGLIIRGTRSGDPVGKSDCNRLALLLTLADTEERMLIIETCSVLSIERFQGQLKSLLGRQYALMF